MNVKAPVDSICPTCGVEVKEQKCNLCGARLTINQVSGNAIWMRNGRLVCAFEDAKRAYVNMAKKYGIPKERWPEQFRDEDEADDGAAKM